MDLRWLYNLLDRNIHDYASLWTSNGGSKKWFYEINSFIRLNYYCYFRHWGSAQDNNTGIHFQWQEELHTSTLELTWFFNRDVFAGQSHGKFWFFIYQSAKNCKNLAPITPHIACRRTKTSDTCSIKINSPDYEPSNCGSFLHFHDLNPFN